jgi:DNA (cytosine-5)-methyltransferase 1
MKKIVVVDLFCGAGALTYGFQKAGLKVSVGIDVDPACQYPFEKNNKAKFLLKDVENLEGTEVNSWFKDADIKILAGCAPCQPFSTYSKSKTKDRQWALLRAFARLVTETSPEIVSMENVPQLTKHPIFEEFHTHLLDQGYRVWFDEISCTSFGVPQTRKRLVLLASKLGEIGPLSQSDSETLPVTVREVINNLEPLKAGGVSKKDRLHTASRLSALNLQRIKASRPGGTWRDWDSSLVAQCHRKPTGVTYPAVYGRMEWDQPAPTITTQCFGFGNGRFGHPEQDRAISLREAALLQTFPPEYEFLPSDEKITFRHIGRLIGNAVPVSFAHAIGRTIITHIHSRS